MDTLNTVKCPACGQEQKASQAFCSFCYAPFAKPERTVSPDLHKASRAEYETPLPDMPDMPDMPNLATLSAPLRLFFCYAALSPLAWWAASLLSALLLVMASINLIFASFPHWLMIGLTGLSGWLTHRFYAGPYPNMAKLYDGGLMPSLQRTLVTLGIFALLATGGYFFLLSPLLGVLVLIGGMIYSWIFLPKDKKRPGLLESFQNLVNATERFEAPGIRHFERLSLCLCLLWFMLAGLAGIDMLVSSGRQTYSVRLLGKQVHSGSKGGRTYSVSLAGWHGRVISHRISSAEYHRLIPARDYQLRTRRGLLMTERMLSLQPAPKTEF
ncbi:MAG: hypothetical protein CVV27_00495 [Candidatus Melainabacteria bacterium HGW-Melainabacteria-1]|nr:MAG: hypothetical protein CVV27_00495 [Candidatus Melainabacteria bacterium HGW-Melainabacteria-1]